MELKFKSTGSTSGFVTWLKGFAGIENTLLIEVDLAEGAFISKCFPPEKNIVKYSKISFVNAGLEVVHVTDDDMNEFDITTTGQRIKVGLYDVLVKFIDVVSKFEDADHTITIKFGACDNEKTGVREFHAEDIQLKSKTLTMKIKNCVINEFFIELSDKVFLEHVYHMDSPIVFNVTTETLKNLISVSGVFSKDQVRDSIRFYTKNDNGQLALYAFDETNDSFDYLLGYCDDLDKVNIEAYAIVFRKNFIQATKSISDNFDIILDATDSSKILVGSLDAKIVISAQSR